MRIPLDQIDADALIRDRSHLDPRALDELQRSIAASGLRHPVEVFATGNGPDPRFALISGYRRLVAVRALHELTGDAKYAAIDAVLREPADHSAALAAMVEENEIRQSLSPWERAAIAVTVQSQGLFDTLDAALLALYPHASRQKRANLRAIAEVVDALGGTLADPETLSLRRLLRLANVLRLGWRELLVEALDTAPADPRAQWDVLRPLLDEAETLAIEGRPTRPDRPKRLSHPRPGLVIRREKTRAGFLLHVTGRGATDRIVEEVLEQVERMFEAG